MSRMLGGLLQKAAGLKSRVDEVKAELKRTEVEGIAGDGAITVIANGEKNIISVKISPEFLATGPDGEKLESLILEATTNALSKASDLQKDIGTKAMGEMGLNLPGIF